MFSKYFDKLSEIINRLMRQAKTGYELINIAKFLQFSEVFVVLLEFFYI